MPIQIGSEFAWNILVATGISFQCLLTGFAVAGARRKYGVDYPDMGSGRFSSKLTDDQWKIFNYYMRAHYNYVEGVTAAVVFQLFSGLFFPRTAALLGVAYLVGRQLYSSLYVKKGPDGRYMGALLLDVALISQLGMVVYGCLRTLGYVN